MSSPLHEALPDWQFRAVCLLTDLMRSAVEAHTEFVTADGDPRRMASPLADLRTTISKLEALATEAAHA